MKTGATREVQASEFGAPRSVLRVRILYIYTHMHSTELAAKGIATLRQAGATTRRRRARRPPHLFESCTAHEFKYFSGSFQTIETIFKNMMKLVKHKLFQYFSNRRKMAQNVALKAIIKNPECGASSIQVDRARPLVTV